MNRKTKSISAASLLLVGLALVGCSSQADTVSENLSKDADEFKIDRRITFINGITDQYLLTIEGKCSQENEGKQVVVTCKIGDGAYKKHFLGLSDNVTYVSEQIESVDVDPYHYKVVFRPEALLPDIDLQSSDDPENADK